ncbi:MAG: NAD(P)H-dependent oxidoreductase [Chloroflexi bacterium]|nr:NAD(P)H-dependent oxidoreductase [Chloroflexota bacterium]
MRVAVVCGNPKPKSRTLEAALFVAKRLCDRPPEVVLDLVDIGSHLLGWGDPVATDAVQQVCACDIGIFASPTYKGSYTGLLKLFLDQVPTDGLNGMLAFPVMLGAAMGHALAPEVFLKPVLVELGASCPARGLYLLETDYASEELIDAWVARAKPFLPR